MAQVLAPQANDNDVEKTDDVKPSKLEQDEKEQQEVKSKDDETEDNDENNENSNRRKIGRWYLAETLGKGGYSWVKKGYDCKTGAVVALKFMDRKRSAAKGWNEKQIKQVKTEIEALRQIKHANVMRLLAYNLNAKYPSKDNEGSREVILLVLEHMSGGELFDILYYTKALEEVIARTYFQQLIDGLEYCHNACIIHRDLKPQNLLLDKNFMLKITDFGLAKLIESDNDAIMETYHVGTRGYQAPEILLKKPYTAACDIFSCGVVLFILLTGYPPFEHARAEDRWYGSIVKKEYKKFWKFHRGCGATPIAMDLITNMIVFDPDERITIADIKKHPWYLDEILPQKELAKVLRLRHAQMEIKRATDPLKSSILAGSGPKRPIPIKEPDEKYKPAPPLPEDETVGLLDVFTEQPAFTVLSYIEDIIKTTQGSSHSLDLPNYSMKITMNAKLVTDDNTNETAEILIRIFYYRPYDCNIVQFRRVSGKMNIYKLIFDYITKNAHTVLTGVPQKVRKNFDLTEDDKELVNKYFKESVDIENKNENKNEGDD